MHKNNNHENTTQLDDSNKSTKWKDVIAAELVRKMACETCKDLDRESKAKPSPDFKKIRSHFDYDVKHDRRRKEILVAGVHLTNTPLSSTYSGSVLLKGITLVMLLAKLNGLESWGNPHEKPA